MSEPVYLVYVYTDLLHRKECLMEIGAHEGVPELATLLYEVRGDLKVVVHPATAPDVGAPSWYKSDRDMAYTPTCESYHQIRAFITMIEMGEPVQFDLLPYTLRSMCESALEELEI